MKKESHLVLDSLKSVTFQKGRMRLREWNTECHATHEKREVLKKEKNPAC